MAERDSFRFRHALTHEAVLAGLLPPERTLLAGRALAAAEAAHPGLPGGWCTLAADLAPARRRGPAGELPLEAGRRDLAVGALASAEHTLTRARDLAGPTLRTSVDEALAEVFAMSGQVDRAIETGRTLLARLGPPSPRAANLHLGIARAAIAGAGGPKPPRASRSPATRRAPIPPRSTPARPRSPRARAAWRRRTGWPGPRCKRRRAARGSRSSPRSRARLSR